MLERELLQKLYREHRNLRMLFDEVTDPELIDRLITRIHANEKLTSALREYLEHQEGRVECEQRA